MMIRTHGMFHRMFAGTTANRHDNTGKGIGKRHMLSGFQIGTVLNCAGKVFTDILDSSKCIHISHQVGYIGNITFYMLSGDEEIWDLARKIQETYPEYREAME